MKGIDSYTDRIICGDCIEVMKGMPDNSVDLVLTDPPYGINYKSNARTVKFNKITNDQDISIGNLFHELFRLSKNNSHLYCWTRWDVMGTWKNEIDKYYESKNCLIIPRRHQGAGDLKCSFASMYEMCLFATKGRRGFNETKLFPVEYDTLKDKRNLRGYSIRPRDLMKRFYSGVFNLDLLHPTQKTTEITKAFIELSTNPGDLVLDPFLGSGTTAVACKELDRKYIGIEISPEYCEIAQKRVDAVHPKLGLEA